MSKYVKRVETKLAKRIASYEQTCKERGDNGKGFHKPGSRKAKPN